jgi:hypothetical protein
MNDSIVTAANRRAAELDHQLSLARQTRMREIVLQLKKGTR